MLILACFPKSPTPSPLLLSLPPFTKISSLIASALSSYTTSFGSPLLVRNSSSMKYLVYILLDGAEVYLSSGLSIDVLKEGDKVFIVEKAVTGEGEGEGGFVAAIMRTHQALPRPTPLPPPLR